MQLGQTILTEDSVMQHSSYELFLHHVINYLPMLYVIQSTITHRLALVKFSIFVKFQENVFPHVNPVSIFVYQFDSGAIDMAMWTGLPWKSW
jgi:hypothetical protein